MQSARNLWNCCAIVMICLSSCAVRSSNTKVPVPSSTLISVPSNGIQDYDGLHTEVLARYLKSSPRWSAQLLDGSLVAFRRTEREFDGRNGYFTELSSAGGELEGRVAITFGTRLKHDVSETVTNIKNESGSIKLTIGGELDAPWKSCVVLNGENICIAIYEKSGDKDRHFTSEAIKNVILELEDVLQHVTTVRESGLLPASSPFAQNLPTSPYLIVEQAEQSGLYRIKGAINPDIAGVAYLRVFDGNVQISPKLIENQSMRFVGWNAPQGSYFPYSSNVTLYGGKAGESESVMKFELWHRSDAGEEVMLAETKQLARKWIR